MAPVVAIAGGLGVFTPRKPPIDNLSKFEDQHIHYIIKEPSFFTNKNIVISGGGDSALDWALFLLKILLQALNLFIGVITLELIMTLFKRL